MPRELPSSRRDLLRSAARALTAGRPDCGIHIASFVVLVRPEHLDRTRDRLLQLPGLEIHASDPRGKLVVTLEAPSDGAIADLMHRISDLPGMLSCTLAHHHSEPSAGAPA